MTTETKISAGNIDEYTPGVPEPSGGWWDFSSAPRDADGFCTMPAYSEAEMIAYGEKCANSVFGYMLAERDAQAKRIAELEAGLERIQMLHSYDATTAELASRCYDAKTIAIATLAREEASHG